MLEILFLFLVAGAVRGLVNQTRQDLARWRGQRGRGARPGRRGRVSASGFGYWLNQALHGFPAARHGAAMGWYQSGQAHHETRSAMLKAQAEHAEHQLSHAGQAAEFRRRRDEALARIRRQADHDEALWEDRNRAEHPEWYAPPCLHPSTRCLSAGCLCRCGDCERFRAQARQSAAPDDDEPDWTPYSWGRADRSYLSQAASEAQARRFAFQASRVNHGCYAAWEGLVLLAVYENGAEVPTRHEDTPEPDEDGQPGEPEQQNDPDQQDEPGQQDEPAGQSNAGGSMATYAGVKARMDKAQTDAEGLRADAEASISYTEEHAELAREAKSWASTTSDEMQALKVDAATLSAMAEHLDALDGAEKLAGELVDLMTRVKDAWGKVGETAATVKSQLDASGHGGVQEARDNAAAGGAEKEFYEEGAGV